MQKSSPFHSSPWIPLTAPFKNSHRKLSALSSSPYSPFTQETILVLMNSFSAQGFSEWYTSRDPNILSLKILSSKTSVHQPFTAWNPNAALNLCTPRKELLKIKTCHYEYMDCNVRTNSKTQLCTYTIVLDDTVLATGCIRRHHTMCMCRSWAMLPCIRHITCTFLRFMQ